MPNKRVEWNLGNSAQNGESQIATRGMRPQSEVELDSLISDALGLPAEREDCVVLAG